MISICLFVAGSLRASLPTTELVVAWDHSVEKTRWEERYRVDGRDLRLVEARIRSFGAGMEPPADARLVNGWWTWRPKNRRLARLRLTASTFTRDYDLCWSDRCSPLRRLIGERPPPSDAAAGGPTDDEGTVVELMRCDRLPSKAGFSRRR
ncbi:MAG: DUF1850 domain-containing protein [Betaproteobacteria bacterium]